MTKHNNQSRALRNNEEESEEKDGNFEEMMQEKLSRNKEEDAGHVK